MRLALHWPGAFPIPATAGNNEKSRCTARIIVARAGPVYSFSFLAAFAFQPAAADRWACANASVSLFVAAALAVRHHAPTVKTRG
jgi:hypothetical protein